MTEYKTYSVEYVEALEDVAEAAYTHAHTQLEDGFATIRRNETALFDALNKLQEQNDGN